jgi:hypothetical protein
MVGGKCLPESIAPSSAGRSMHGHRRRTQETIVKNDEKEVVLDGGYVQHKLNGGIAMVVRRALIRAAMPVWEKGEECQSVVRYISPCALLTMTF